MNRRQNAYMEMFRALESYVDSNDAIWTGSAFFETPYTTFKDNLPKLEELISNQETPTTGYAAQKEEVRDQLEAIALKVSYCIKAYAITTDKLDLFNSMPKAKRVFVTASDNSLIGICKKVYDIASSNAAALLGYGMTAGMPTELSNLLNTFSDLVGTPKVARAGTKRATEDLDQLISETNELLSETLDTAARVFYISNEDFAQQYFLVRSIDDPAYGKLALRVNVIDADTHAPVADVEVTIMPDNVKRRTSTLGNCQVDSLDAGNITITFQKFGYVQQDIIGAINDGETTELKVLMHKNPPTT
jgi:hypothetical protein